MIITRAGEAEKEITIKEVEAGLLIGIIVAEGQEAQAIIDDILLIGITTTDTDHAHQVINTHF